MENPAVSSIRKRSSKSRSRSNTPIQKHFLSSPDSLSDPPAMNTRSSSRCSSRQCFVVLEDSVYQQYTRGTSDYNLEDNEYTRGTSDYNLKDNEVSRGTSDYGSEDNEVSPQTERKRMENENRSNGRKEMEKSLMAYKEYHEAGEYWNKYPKTDYTYSKRSPHRRELPSGSVALPNMSRPSLHSYDERMENKYNYNEKNYGYDEKNYGYDERSRLAEKVAREDKCTSRTYTGLTRIKNVYSTESPYRERYSANFSNLRFNGRDVTDVRLSDQQIGFVSKTWHKIKNFALWTKSWFVNTEETQYRTPYRGNVSEQRGYISRVYSTVTNSSLRLMTYLYWLIGSILVLDCKLLCGKENPPTSRFKAKVWLVLLPLLLLCGFYTYLTLTQPEYYPFDRPLTEYPYRIYNSTVDTMVNSVNTMVDVMVDSVEYGKVQTQNGLNELTEFWEKVKVFGNSNVGQN